MWYLGNVAIVEEDHALVVNALLWTTIAFVVVCLRMYTRIVVIHGLGLDDWLMLVALMASIGYLISLGFQLKYGLGQPVNLANLTPFLQAIYATVPCYNLAQTFYKLSIIVQASRLFTAGIATKLIRCLIAWIIACGILSVSGSLFWCSPIAKAWDSPVDGWCVDRANLNYAISGFNIVNDLLLLSIPAPFIFRLQLPQKQRIVLYGVFACGVFVTIVSCIRLKSLWADLSESTEIQATTGVDIALWSGLEINVAIICGSAPALNAFIRRVILRKSSLNASSGAQYAGSTTATWGGGGGRRNPTVAEDSIEEGGMTITVQRDVEMKTYAVDDTGSERELIETEAFSPAFRNTVVI